MARKKKGNYEEPAEEGEAWLASYADLMSLMFCFFVLLFSISNIEEEQEEMVRKSLIATFKADQDEVIDYFKKSSKSQMMMQSFDILVDWLEIAETRDDAMEKILKTDKSEKETENIRTYLKKKFDQKGLMSKLKEDDNRNIIKVVIPSSEIFIKGKSKYTQKAEGILREIIQEAAKFEGLISVEVINHSSSDEMDIGSKKSIFYLTTIRSAKIADHLRNELSPSSDIFAIGMGNQKTISYQDAEWNSRVEILIKKRSEDET